MQRTRTIAMLAAAATLTVACNREKKPDTATAESPASQPAAAAAPVQDTAAQPSRPELQPQSARLELGYDADPSGAVLEGLRSRQFNTGSPFVLGVRVDDLPPGTDVVATFTGPAGEELARQTRTTTAGVRYLSFPSPDTTAWPEGDLHVEVKWNGAAQGTIAFRLDRPKSGQA